MFPLPSRILGPSPCRGEFSSCPCRCINLWANWVGKGGYLRPLCGLPQTLWLILSEEQKGSLQLTEAGLHNQVGARSSLEPLPWG